MISLVIWLAQLVFSVLCTIAVLKLGVLPPVLLGTVLAVLWIMAAVVGLLVLTGWKKKLSLIHI